jgi:hypothetical protein
MNVKWMVQPQPQYGNCGAFDQPKLASSFSSLISSPRDAASSAQCSFITGEVELITTGLIHSTNMLLHSLVSFHCQL